MRGGTDSHKYQFIQIWISKVSSRVALFAWEASRESILTIDKLMTRGHIMVNKCYLCMKTVVLTSISFYSALRLMICGE